MNRWIACPMWLGLLMLAGCTAPTETTAITRTVDQIDFGDPYVIAGGDHPPYLAAGDLYLTVQYSGGCENHAFAIRSRIQNDTTEVWLQHNSNGDLCEAYLTDPLTLRVPEAVRDASHITLLGPEGQAFTLR